jgi:hypothetical protein
MPVQITSLCTSLCENVNDDQIKKFEHELGKTLPQPYKGFLLNHNAAKTDPNTFYISPKQGTNLIRYFLGICEVEWYSLHRHIEIYSGRIPANFVPIAVDYFGNLICLSVDGHDYGKVYFWDHDWEPMGSEDPYANVYLLADDFSQFLDSLYQRNNRDDARS